MVDIPGDDGGLGRPNPFGFAAHGLAEGLGSNATLRAYREAGGRIGNQRFRQLYNEVRDTYAREPNFLSSPRNAIPDPSLLGTWSMGKGGQYAMQVVIRMRDEDTGLAFKQFYTVVSDQPFTPAWAEGVAMADFGRTENQDKYPNTVQGALAIHGWQTVPWKGN